MERTVEIDGLKLFYEVTGSGSPLILMHGWGCDHTTVASIAASAAETHTVYSLDLPGFGRSDEPREVWGVDEYTDIVEKFVHNLGLERPVLVGHSYGGRISILFASRNDVSKVILVDSAGVKPSRPLSYYIKVYSFKLSRKMYQLILGRKKAEERIERMRASRGSADYAAASPMMRRVLSKSVSQDLRSVMPLIKAPTLIIWGEDDTATPMRDARIMERLIPDAGLVSFPGCGHYSFLDNPVQFAAVIKSFLKS